MILRDMAMQYSHTIDKLLLPDHLRPPFMVRSNGARIFLCGLHNDDQLLEIEVLHRESAPVGLVSTTEEEEEATMDTLGSHKAAALAVQGS